MAKKDKNAGLSEEQRLEKARIEQEIEKSRQRFIANLKPFRDEYNNLVEKYGIVHDIRWRFDRVAGPAPIVTEVDVFKAVEAEKKRREDESEIVKEDSAIVKS